MGGRPETITRQVSSDVSRRYRPQEEDATILTSDVAIHRGRVAVVTGAAIGGIGFAAAKKFARYGLSVCIADVDTKGLAEAEAALKKLPDVSQENIMSVVTDVTDIKSVENLREEATRQFGEVNCLLHAAAIAKGKNGSIGTAMENAGAWKDVFDVNLGGTINVVQTFAPSMAAQENPGCIILTGSKQGITNPPGNAAYNTSKAAVRFLAENLAHELRSQGSRTTAHFFVPGWTHTKMTGATPNGTKPDGAYTPEETVRYMFDKVRRGDFYVICPDHETTADLDRLRMKWATQDVCEGRPALSRWHPEWKPVFKEFIEDHKEKDKEM